MRSGCMKPLMIGSSPIAAISVTSRARSSGSAWMRRTCSSQGTRPTPVSPQAAVKLNGWNVWKPRRMDTVRPWTWGRTATPSAAAWPARSSRRRHWSGSALFCSSANVIGRPTALDSRRIQSTSRSGAARSSPSAPAAASSNTPVPSSPSTAPMPNSSSSAANVPGTGSPSIARWASVREVENPRAPARMPSRTMAAMAAMSSVVAGSLAAPRSPIT